MKLSFLLSFSAFAVGSVFSDLSVLAQVTTDGTTSTTVTPNDTGVQIDSGNRSGDNLFHSFDEFSVPTNSEAFFNNANDVVNIFSRVTGGNISNIDGTLRANGAANLFLINPAGIVFGENARLQLGGSFYGSTADSIIFPDGKFSATDLENPPLITVNAPIGLGFRDNPNSITVRGNGNGVRAFDSEVIDTNEALRVGESATIGILGGELIFEDATVKTAGGRIEIGSVAGGEVDLVAVENGFSFDYSRIESFQDISLSGTSIIDASGLGSGEINVTGNNIAIADISGLISYTLGSIPGNDINLFAADSITVNGVANENNFVSAIVSQTLPQGTADAGDINIETGSLEMGDRNLISTFVSGQGNAGNIEVNANSVALNNASQLNTGSAGQGVSGDVIINATDDISLLNGSIIFVSGVEGGSINISAKNLSLISDSNLIAGINIDSGFADAQAGDILINLTEDLVIDGLDGESSTAIANNNFGTGNTGNIDINARNITFQNGGNILIANNGAGNIGNINLTATGNILFDGIKDFSQSAGISTFVNVEATGDVGEINLTAQNLTLTNGAAISSIVGGIASSGDLNFNITDTITIDGFGEKIVRGEKIVFPSFIESIVGDTGIGNSGAININTHNLHLSRNGNINGSIVGQGNAGDININANLITISEQGNINRLPSFIGSNVANKSLEDTSVPIEAQAGNITIDANSLLITDGGVIRANVSGTGNSGNISITVADTLSLDGSGIFKSPETGKNRISTSGINSDILGNSQGNSGNIDISTPNLSITNGASISTDNLGLGNAGDININANNINLDGETPLFTSQVNEELTEVTVSSSISSQVGGDSFLSSPTTGNGGNININTDSLSITNGANISTNNNSGLGNAGDINITASNLKIDGKGNEFTELVFNDGRILRTQSRSRISSSLFSNIDFVADGRLAEGNGGNIIISTDSLSITNGAFISTDNNGIGNSGNVTINATKDIVIDGSMVSFFDGEPRVNPSQISSDVLANGIGNGGNVTINTPQLSVSSRAEISTSTFSEGNAGTLTIKVTDSLDLSGNSLIIADVFSNATGNGGNLFLETARLNVANGGQISASTGGKGSAGTLTVSATDSIELNGVSDGTRSGLFTSVRGQDNNGGELKIFTQDLIVSDGATISASNLSSTEDLREPGTGEAGSVTIEAKNITLVNEGRINTLTQAGDKGNITLNVAEDIVLRDNSFISTQASKEATGGNISIDAEFIIAFPSRFDGNDIRADANQGQGGNINITAESVFGISESKTLNPLTNDINASSQVAGLSGTISINTPDINPLRATSELPSNFISANTLAATSACNASSIEELSNLILKGKGGILPQATDSFTSDSLITEESADNLSLLNSNLIQSDRSLLLNNLTQNSRETKIPFGIKPAIETEETGKLYAARGITQQEDGTVYLTAYPTSERQRASAYSVVDCSD